MRLLARALILAGFGFFLGLIVLLGFLWAGRQVPPQPIPFSHARHAGVLGLPCSMCHVYAERSPRAGAPYVETCMSCHRTIATDREGIQTLTRHWQEGEPILWERVYALPDFIRFSHQRHLAAGAECAACHGGVAGMEVMYPIVPLHMGWCVSCHRSWRVTTDCAACHY